MELADYLATVTKRLADAGFETIPSGPAGAVALRRRSQGKALDVETVVVVGRVVDPGSVTTLRRASREAFAFAKKLATTKKARTTRLVVYSLMAASVLSDEACAFSRRFHPKHWMAAEVPVVVNLASRDVMMFEGRALWGAANFPAYRRDVAQWFKLG